MSECRYVPLESRAAVLIEKGVRAWQEIQRLAITEEELLDSVVLLGQELWLPHHETDPSRYHTTLRIGVHLPRDTRAAPETRIRSYFRELEARSTDEQRGLRVDAELR